MASGKVLISGSKMKNLEPLWIHESKSMISFKNVDNGNKSETETETETAYFRQLIKEEDDNEDFDESLSQPGKKRRLSADQVFYLERNFDVENKLEPERKVELANELGLQPRQVAIWFQNRRARFKTKQLEKDYDVLKMSFNDLKSEFDSVLKDNEMLKTEILLLKDRLSEKLESSKSEEANASSTIVICKQEDTITTSSTKSELFDSDASPSTLFEAEKSGFLQEAEEDDLICKNFLESLSYAKIQDGYSDLSTNSYNFGFQDDDQPFWLSHY